MAMATKDKSTIVSGMGVGMSIIQRIAEKVWNRGVPDEVIHSNLYPVTVNYGLSLAEMITAGKYDEVDDKITQNCFPVEGEGAVDIKIQLVHFGRRTESNEAIHKLNAGGLRPATLPELLAFGAKFPESCESPIAAIGSVWRRGRDHRSVPYLWDDGYGLSLHLHDFEVGWYGSYRFAAVRK